jgi:ribosomal protein S18 acetylase RimI-like enzyme
MGKVGEVAVGEVGESVIEIRPAREDEYLAVGELVESAFRSLLGSDLSENYANELRDVAIRARSTDVFVALLGERIVGSVTYVGDPSSPFAEELEAGEVGVRMLAVDPAVQGSGVGRAMMEFCKLRAQADRARAIFLFSTPAMVAAHRLYRSMGFSEPSERTLTVGNGLCLLPFRLEL